MMPLNNTSRAVQVGDHDPEPAVDWFTGASLVVEQIDEDVRKELPQKLLRLVSAHRAKSATGVKLAAEDLAKFLGGMQSVADSLVRSSIQYLNRRARA
jgi:hypothetical protein